MIVFGRGSGRTIISYYLRPMEIVGGFTCEIIRRTSLTGHAHDKVDMDFRVFFPVFQCVWGIGRFLRVQVFFMGQRKYVLLKKQIRSRRIDRFKFTYGTFV